MEFKSIYSRGIDQDSSKNNYPKGAYLNLENGRLLTDEGISNGNAATTKGTQRLDLDGLPFTIPTKIFLAAAYQKYYSDEMYSDIADGDYTNADALNRINTFSWDQASVCGSASINDDLIVITRLFDGSTDTNDMGFWRLTPIGGIANTSAISTEIEGVDYYMQLIYLAKDINEYNDSDQIKIEVEAHYESSRVQVIYFADGHNSLRRLNIVANDVFFLDEDLLDVVVSAKINPPRFTGISSNGSLDVGYVQYATKYKISKGQESRFSLPSQLIHLTTSDESSDDAGRQYKGEYPVNTEISNNTGATTGSETTIVTTTGAKDSAKSVTIEVADLDQRYDQIEIVSIHYSYLSADPIINIVYDGPFNGDTLTFTDFGLSSLGSYTLAEYRLYNTDFIPQTICVKDNILLVGNIEEKYFSSDNWDDFDARSFRFDYDLSGNCESRIYDDINEVSASTPKDNDTHYLMQSLSGTVSYTSVNKYVSGSVDSNVDLTQTQKINAVNRLNNLELTPNQLLIPDTTSVPEYNYKYKSDGVTIGGSGPNVNFEFISKSLEVQTKEYTDVTDGPYTVKQSEDNYRIDTKTLRDELDIGPSSYASPYNAGVYRQYKRNEIYRFAVVVYDKKGLPSLPKWIADIRTPVYNNNLLYNDLTNQYDIVTYSETGGVGTCSANALGINFDITIPTALKDEIQGYSIVRCERDQTRTNLGQGMINTLRSFDAAGDDGGDTGGYCSTYDGLNANVNNLFFVPGFVDPDTASDGVNTAAGSLFGYDNYLRSEFITPEGTFNTNLKGFNSSFLQPIGCVSHDYFGLSDYGVNKYKLMDSFSTSRYYGYIDDCQFEMTQEYNFVAAGYSWTKDVGNKRGNQYFHSFSNVVESNTYPHLNTKTPVASIIQQSTVSISNVSRLSQRETKYLTGAYIAGWNAKYGGGVDMLIAPGMYMDLDEKPLPVSLRNVADNTDDMYWIVADYIRPTIPYGGVEYSKRELNTYYYANNFISIDEHVDGQQFSNYSAYGEADLSSNKVGKSVYGGDTFIGYYQHVRATVDAESEASDRFTNTLTFPVESTINLNLRHDRYIPTYSDEFNINLEAEVTVEINPTTDCMSTQITQLEDLYLYNSVFSKSDSAFVSQNVPDDEYENNIFNTRIIASNKKIIGESYDSWSIFGTNEFIDLNTTNGELNKLVNYKDGVYAFQNEGISRVAINEKSVIQDDSGQSLVLGIGGVLPYATYITDNSGTRHKWSVVGTPELLYYYDSNNNTMNYLASANGAITDVKGLFKLMSDFDTPNLNDVESVYVDKYREIETVFDFSNSTGRVEDGGRIIVFNEKIKAFSHTYDWQQSAVENVLPFKYMKTSKYVMSTRRTGSAYGYGTSIYAHDLGAYNTYYGNYKSLVLTLLINPFQDNTTMLDSIDFNSVVQDKSIDNMFDAILNDETITSIRAYNSYQDTGYISLTETNARGSRYVKRNARKWRYNYFRDSLQESKLADPRLWDSYFMLELRFNSKAIDSNSSYYFELGNITSKVKDPNQTRL